MNKFYLLCISILLVSHPAIAAMTGGGGGSYSSSSNSSSSSSNSSSSSSNSSSSSSSPSNSSQSSSSSGSENNSSVSNSTTTSYSSTQSGSYGTKKKKKKYIFDPFDHVYGLIRLEKFAEAHQSLQYIRVPTPSKQADRLNLLGFTARKSGDLSSAAQYYSEALEINPKHIQALEYQGELYLQLGEIDKAKQNLEKIKQICWLVCKEKKMLEKAIEVTLN